jgi:hypothetical protein
MWKITIKRYAETVGTYSLHSHWCVAMASLMVGSSTPIEQVINAQNMTNTSRLTGVEN